jgi:hypothetical protein
VKPEKDDEYKDNFLIKFFETNGDGFNWYNTNDRGSKERPAKANHARIAVPPTKEEQKKNQQRLFQSSTDGA